MVAFPRRIHVDPIDAGAAESTRKCQRRSVSAGFGALVKYHNEKGCKAKNQYILNSRNIVVVLKNSGSEMAGEKVRLRGDEMTGVAMCRKSSSGMSRRGLSPTVSSFALVIATTLSIGLVGSAARAQAVVLRGAGSTFAAPLYKKWIEEFAVSRPSTTITYDVVGSGEGVRRFLANSVDFAGSDEILTDSESAKVGRALMIPVTAGMIAISYNIPGVNSEIRLPRDVYVDIFSGKIQQWDDARLLQANPGITFPHRDIAIVARQDSSGTTSAFTHHLAAIGPSWQASGMAVGKVVEWPKGTMLAPGNEGVAGRIKISEGSIGYVEFWFAQRLGLRMAAVQNKAGKFVTPTASAGEFALSGRVANVRELDASVADPGAPGAYPITTYSWMFLYPKYGDPARESALHEFAEWGISQQGQDFAAQLGYLPLTPDVVALGRHVLGAVGP